MHSSFISLVSNGVTEHILLSSSAGEPLDAILQQCSLASVCVSVSFCLFMETYGVSLPLFTDKNTDVFGIFFFFTKTEFCIS